jgi:transposase
MIGMATRLVNIDRDTPMMFPVSLQEWLPENHLARFIVDAVETLDTSVFKINKKGTGSEQMPPSMMVALLIYCYATGTFGSRRIEAATYTDIAVMYICGAKAHPNFTVICDFRRENREAFNEAFNKVLMMAVETKKMKKVGKISVDGTKLKANASKHSAVSYERAQEMIEEIDEEVKELMGKAEGEDNQPLEEGLTIPDEIARRKTRKAALEEAKKAMERRYQEAEEARKKEAEEAGKKAEAGKPLKEYQHNFTDSESRIMKAGTGKHFEQCYNAEAAVDAEGSMLIVGGYVTNHGNDKKGLKPVVDSVAQELREVTGVLADTGFYSEEEVKAVEKEDAQGKRRGPEVYCAVEKTSHHRSVKDIEKKREPRLKEGASAKEKMAHKLRTKKGRAIYKARKETVEPVFGIIKGVIGFRQFLLRGLEKVNTEWDLVKAAYNFKKLHRMLYGIPVPACPVVA